MYLRTAAKRAYIFKRNKDYAESKKTLCNLIKKVLGKSFSEQGTYFESPMTPGKARARIDGMMFGITRESGYGAPYDQLHVQNAGAVWLPITSLADLGAHIEHGVVKPEDE